MSGISRSALQTFAQGLFERAAPDLLEAPRRVGPPPDPPEAVRILRRDEGGGAMFWEDGEGRLCGGPGAPIRATLPTWSEWLALHPPESTVGELVPGELPPVVGIAPRPKQKAKAPR